MTLPPGEEPGSGPPLLHHVGLVADTHGLFRPALEALLTGVEMILHAGDVGSPEVLRQLRRIAPVTAVCGNADNSIPGFCLPGVEKLELFGLRVLLTHVLGAPDYTLPEVERAIAAYRPRLVVHGHTHHPDFHLQNGVFYVNPGSCGPRRQDLPITCAVLTVTERPGAEEVAVAFHNVETGTHVWRRGK